MVENDRQIASSSNFLAQSRTGRGGGPYL